MEQSVDWKGFRIRLRRAIDRWPHGGHRAFAKALKAYAARNRVKIPTSYRTLVNYLNGETRPSLAWVEAAAAVLKHPPGFLLSGMTESGEQRPDDWTGLQLQFAVSPESAPRAEALAHFILGGYLDLPWEARLIMHGFVGFFFGHDTDGWDDREGRRSDVEDVVQTYFAPLCQPSAARMGEVPIMALAASLAASAYLQLDPSLPQNKHWIDPAGALADLKRRELPRDLDVPDIERRAGPDRED